MSFLLFLFILFSCGSFLTPFLFYCLVHSCLFYLTHFVSSLILRFTPKNDLCPCSRAELLSGSSAGNRAPRLSSCVSRVYENLWMWNLLKVCVFVCLCVYICVWMLKGTRGERDIVCGHVLGRDCISECVYHMCVYA